MLRIGIGVLAILLFCSEAIAERYWVLGSYSNRKNAFAEQERLSQVLKQDVLVVPNAASGTFRVIVLESIVPRETLSAAGVDAWLTDLTVNLTANKVEPIADGVAPALPPFEPGEDISHYCARVTPLPEFCNEEAISSLQSKQERLEAVSAELARVCESAIDDTEREICESWKRRDAVAGNQDSP